MTRYFCHSCKRMMASIKADYTCLFCDRGFIEESATDLSQEEHLAASPLDLIQLINLGIPPAAQQSSSPAPSSSSTRQSRPGTFHWSRMDTHPALTPPSSTTTTTTGANNQGYRLPFIENSTDNMLYSFISDLVMGLGGGQYGPGLPLAANWGDYVWGRDGLDALVTQLMNNMEGTGPAPLEDEKIARIPSIRIGAGHVEGNLRCSVCWDDFYLDEEVRQLPCEHVYHHNCIVPWLKLHGTCPVCRKVLNEDEEAEEEQEAGAPMAVVGVVAAAEGLLPGEAHHQAPNNNNGHNNAAAGAPRYNVEMDFD